jgi:hypothetical protein
MESLKSYLRRVRDSQFLRLSDYLRSRFGAPIQPKIEVRVMPKLLRNITRILRGMDYSDEDVVRIMDAHPNYVGIITNYIKPYVDAVRGVVANADENEHNRVILTLYLSILQEEYSSGMELLEDILSEESLKNQNLSILLQTIPYKNHKEHLFSMIKDIFDNILEDEDDNRLLKLSQGTLAKIGGIFNKVYSIDEEINEVETKLSEIYTKGVKRAMPTDFDSYEVSKKMRYQLGGGYYINLAGLKERHLKKLIKRVNRMNRIR